MGKSHASQHKQQKKGWKQIVTLGALQRTQHVWMILGTQLLVKHKLFWGRLLLAVVAYCKLVEELGLKSVHQSSSCDISRYIQI